MHTSLTTQNLAYEDAVLCSHDGKPALTYVLSGISRHAVTSLCDFCSAFRALCSAAFDVPATSASTDLPT